METLYHYCSNQSFLSIVENRSIWLSSMSLSNDYMEGKLIKEILMEIAECDGLGVTAIKRLKLSVEILGKINDGLGFCLSEKGDLLSQWRGYAEDASGVSIGFSKDYLEQLAKESGEITRKTGVSGFKLEQVEYTKEKQEKRITPTYLRIKELIEEGAFRIPVGTRSKEEAEREDAHTGQLKKVYDLTVLTLIFNQFFFKSKAFSEEHEWRLLSHFLKDGEDECLLRASKYKMIPYRDYKLSELEITPIVEVILGPKNITPIHVVNNLMKQNGFNGVEVRCSEASYR